MWIFLVGSEILGGVRPAVAKDFFPSVQGLTPPAINRPNPYQMRPTSGGRNPSAAGQGLFTNSRSGKIVRAPSGFRTVQPLRQNQGLNGGATGIGAGKSNSNDISSSSSSKKSSSKKSSWKKPSSEKPSSNGSPSNESPLNGASSSKEANGPEILVKKKKKRKSDLTEQQAIEAYNHFILKMKQKGFEANISQERFLELAKNPQTGQFDQKSVSEATGGLQFEIESLGKAQGGARITQCSAAEREIQENGPLDENNERNPQESTQQNSQKLSQKEKQIQITAHNGKTYTLIEKSESHLTSKHGDAWNIDDPIEAVVDSRGRIKITTRINKENRQTFRESVTKTLQDPKSEIIVCKMRGTEGVDFRTKNHGNINKYQYGNVVVIPTEGKFKNVILKAQPLGREQLGKLREFGIID